MVGAQKRTIRWTMSLLIAVCLLSSNAHAQYGGGNGEPNDPYLIYTDEQMNAIGSEPNDWDKHFKLMADIDLSVFDGKEGRPRFNIIGTRWDNPFTGVFNGNGHTISNFSYTSTDTDNIGLFGYIGYQVGPGYFVSKGKIKDLGLIDPNIDAGTGNTIGSLAGILIAGAITNCYVEGGSITGGMRVGGLIGDNVDNVTGCYSTGAVSGNSSLGGLLGDNGGDVTHCYSTGTVSGNIAVGGLAGKNWRVITNCYSTGSVLGSSEVGGLVGSNWGKGTVTNSFWDIETSGQATSDGGTGKTTVEMQMASTFMNAGWDFVGQPDGLHDIWAEPFDGGYPILSWQLPNRSGLSTFSGGTGEPNEPYLISTAEDLNRIGHNPRLMAAHFKLLNDIDLAGIGFYIIGSELYPFDGVFDGNGKKISNLNYTSAEQDIVGLFGYVEGATIKDLGLINPNIDAGTGHTIGSLAGILTAGNITNCYSQGGSVSGNEGVGGLVGSNGALMTGCFTFDTTVSGTGSFVGGLVGESTGKIVQCYSSGCYVSGNRRVGGLVGLNDGEISNCYAICYAIFSVMGSIEVGGLVGYQGYDSYGTIANCYANCNVSGYYVGGLVGENHGGTIISSFWDTQMSGQNRMCGNEGWGSSGCDNSKGKTTAEMQTRSTFTNAGWDFVDETANGTEDIWWILEGQDYPRLCWENKPGEGPETQQLSDFLTGAGTEDDPYLIYTAEELNTIGLFRNDWDKHFKLMSDIDLAGFTGTDFNIIGMSHDNAFSGVFDGNGHTISNFTYTYKGKRIRGIGLFGYINDLNAEIKDLGLIDPNLDVGTEFAFGVGSLAGCLEDGTISNCYAEGGCVSGVAGVGGLVGICTDAIIIKCFTSDITISATVTHFGGLVGLSTGSIKQCHSTGCIVGGQGWRAIGGLVGVNDGEISNSYAIGRVWGTTGVGGLVGYQGYDSYGTIANCYANCNVWGFGDVGGLVGGNDAGTITTSFWDTQTSGQYKMCGNQDPGSSGCDNTKGKTTAEMQTRSTFTNAGWDFVDEIENGTEDIWWILEGQDYPRLWWELIPEN